MPLTEKNLEFESSVDFGTLMYDDERSEPFLGHVSPYNTLRGGDLKYGTDPSHRTIQEVLLNWNKDALPKSPKEEGNEPLNENEMTTDSALKAYELPVIGFNVDSRIAPGFRYSVRRIGETENMFDEAKRLESIGMGYGRRLTFQSDRLNYNDCYFWSDSSPTGFAFNIQALREGDVFTIFDFKSVPIGKVTIETVEHPQIEQETVMENGNVVKNILVRFTNSVRYFSHHCNLVDILNSQELNLVEGVAELVKLKGSKEAFVRCVRNVNLPKVGQCVLATET